MQCAGKVVLVTGRRRGSAEDLSMPVVGVQATVAPSPKGAVMKCLIEILNGEAW